MIYVRGAEQVPVKATIGKTEFELDDGSGVIVRIQSRDFLIHAADLRTERQSYAASCRRPYP